MIRIIKLSMLPLLLLLAIGTSNLKSPGDPNNNQLPLIGPELQDKDEPLPILTQSGMEDPIVYSFVVL